MAWDLSPHFPAATAVLAPEDILAHKVRNVLAADSTLLAIFGADQIETVPYLLGLDFRSFPRLQVAAFASTEQQRVTATDEINPLRIYVRIRYDALDWAPLKQGPSESLSWPYGVASMATLARHVTKVLKANETLTETFPDGNGQLSSEAVEFPSFTFSQDVNIDGNRLALNHDIAAHYVVRLEHSGANAGKITQAASLGG